MDEAALQLGINQPVTKFLRSPLLYFLLKHGLTRQPFSFLHGFRWDCEVLSTTEKSCNDSLKISPPPLFLMVCGRNPALLAAPVPWEGRERPREGRGAPPGAEPAAGRVLRHARTRLGCVLRQWSTTESLGSWAGTRVGGECCPLAGNGWMRVWSEAWGQGAPCERGGDEQGQCGGCCGSAPCEGWLVSYAACFLAPSLLSRRNAWLQEFS